MVKKRLVLLTAAIVLVSLGAGRAAGKGKPAPEPQPPPDPVIAYVVPGPDGAQDVGLWVMNSDGSNKTRVFAGHAEWPGFSPDGSEIAFLSDVAGLGVYVVGIDGTNPHMVVPKESAYLGGGLSWSARGWIAFVDHVGSEEDVLVVRPDGSGLKNLTQTPVRGEFGPVWNATGDRLAVKAMEGGPARTLNAIIVYSVDEVDGVPVITDETNVTDVPGSPISWVYSGADPVVADFARHSDRLAIAVIKSLSRDLWVLDLADLANPRLLESDQTERVHARWCEGDTRIVFTNPYQKTKGKGVAVIWSVDAETGLDLVRLGDSVQWEPACLR